MRMTWETRKTRTRMQRVGVLKSVIHGLSSHNYKSVNPYKGSIGLQGYISVILKRTAVHTPTHTHTRYKTHHYYLMIECNL